MCPQDFHWEVTKTDQSDLSGLQKMEIANQTNLSWLLDAELQTIVAFYSSDSVNTDYCSPFTALLVVAVGAKVALLLLLVILLLYV